MALIEGGEVLMGKKGAPPPYVWTWLIDVVLYEKNGLKAAKKKCMYEDRMLLIIIILF